MQQARPSKPWKPHGSKCRKYTTSNKQPNSIPYPACWAVALRREQVQSLDRRPQDAQKRAGERRPPCGRAQPRAHPPAGICLPMPHSVFCPLGGSRCFNCDRALIRVHMIARSIREGHCLPRKKPRRGASFIARSECVPPVPPCTSRSCCNPRLRGDAGVSIAQPERNV